MSDEGRGAQKCEAGAPPWVMTFADLMSLLMCFFVLLLSFSELDLLKFKQIAGQMEFAFGVQREIKAREIPKGTSVVKKEFSPARPEPTPLNVVRQHTSEDLRRMLETEAPKDTGEGSGRPSSESVEQRLAEEAARAAEELREAFREQIESGLIDIETDHTRVIIRIREQGSFPSGSAQLEPQFQPVIRDIGQVLVDTPGQIVVAGHTDDVPIATARFRSNWELSAARAVSVVHQLQTVPGLDAQRFLIEGHADSRPLVPNDSRENRARNRRVEVVIVRTPGEDPGSDPGADDGPDALATSFPTRPPR